MPTIFRKTPPEDIVLRLLKSFGLTSFHDASWFCKEYVRLDVFEGILLDLEPYYTPCKARDFIHKPLTQSRAFTILRQVLHVYNISLQMSEKSRGNKKTLWYHLENNHLPTDISGGQILFN
jgi:hypothetical protein